MFENGVSLLNVYGKMTEYIVLPSKQVATCLSS